MTRGVHETYEQSNVRRLAGWREDAMAFLEAAPRLNLPASLERHAQGEARVWFFCEDAIPAALARRLGSHVLTETMKGRPDIGVDFYDRLFPSQDTMPQGDSARALSLSPMENKTAQAYVL